MRLPKFLRKRKSKNWSQRVDYWPAEYPHHITTYADVAAMQHIMATGGVLNTAAIDHLLRDEDFWWDLLHFFQGKVDELGEMEFVSLPERSRVAERKIPLCCWESEED